ncbi:MAG: o-succinylbenzoate synthase [Cyanobacteria bacterium]|nr:o-succinylbenzoate synthase [Cyanobacteria bacterium CG_2015-16_32_12]NCO76990.1 o-succinylbenzoate synthase [Cyanobacteria bacterium CG_2015-22_32_23]NCQ03676.1 o-succinylbenzoate synthase [Cyanobacteria bacterium CG_2015-09_32_10]NCQ40373.1 o-succinylbenzoate synthase [Cyanobacteria bacterium CG_2015-04_32_10]NCS85183.1 o-succinylbenzoate synthase [Cyanobacteria bacterium CG_2015-02_32_10]
MKIDQIELYNLSIPFISPFKFSNGELLAHTCLIVAIKSEGLTGWGECPTFDNPYYTYETIKTASHILADFLIPRIINKNIYNPQEIRDLLAPIRGHNMAKSALDCAIWDLFAQSQNLSLKNFLQGVKDQIKVGVSVSLEGNISQLLNTVENYVSQGYQRVKLKISPHWNLKPLQKVRKKYPHLMLMADGNSAFTLDDITLFQEMNELNLIMIEQPLAYDDLLDHSLLQAQINTPICLDESINSLHDTRMAIALKSAQIINLKVSRVGGITNAIEIHNLCEKAGIKLWCGGMLESGIGRATNLHLASLSNFVLPADISATNRYFREDITQSPVYLNPEDSTIDVPKGIGIGIKVDKNLLFKYKQNQEIFRS